MRVELRHGVRVAAAVASLSRYDSVQLSTMAAPAFDAGAFASSLVTSAVGQRLEYRASTSSTMTIADEVLRAEGAAAAHGLVVLAETQTAGVGRRGRAWQSAADGNLYFSLVWSPRAQGLAAMMPEMVRLNLAAGVAVVRACADAGVPSARIKWPNDVWAGDPARKLSGTILNFNGADAAVLGVGINVLQTSRPAVLVNATSITSELQAAGAAAPPSREAVLATFCSELERLMALPPGFTRSTTGCTVGRARANHRLRRAGLGRTGANLWGRPGALVSLGCTLAATWSCVALCELQALSTEGVLDEYRTCDLLAGRGVRVHHRSREEDDPRDYEALVLGVDPQGMLCVRRPDGTEQQLSGEEVSITPRDV